MQKRVESSFGPNLLDWNIVGSEYNLAKRRQSARFPRTLNHCFATLFENDESSEEDAKFYALVAILTLHISCVQDHTEHIWSLLISKLTKNQVSNSFFLLLYCYLYVCRSLFYHSYENLKKKNHSGLSTCFSR